MWPKSVQPGSQNPGSKKPGLHSSGKVHFFYLILLTPEGRQLQIFTLQQPTRAPPYAVRRSSLTEFVGFPVNWGPYIHPGKRTTLWEEPRLISHSQSEFTPDPLVLRKSYWFMRRARSGELFALLVSYFLSKFMQFFHLLEENFHIQNNAQKEWTKPEFIWFHFDQNKVENVEKYKLEYILHTFTGMVSLNIYFCQSSEESTKSISKIFAWGGAVAPPLYFIYLGTIGVDAVKDRDMNTADESWECKGLPCRRLPAPSILSWSITRNCCAKCSYTPVVFLYILNIFLSRKEL